MNTDTRCQSCAMPLGEGFHGENTDGSKNLTYCKLCWHADDFKEPKLTVGQMIERSIKHMTTELQISLDKSEKLAKEVIPTLKRWNNK